MLKTVSNCLLKPNAVQTIQSRNRWNSLRHQYLKKAPIIRIDPDGTYNVEGVSNKQTPIPVLWREPVKVPRVTLGADGSGDLDGLSIPDLSRPIPRIEQSPLWNQASPEVRKVLSLEFQRNKDVVGVIAHDLVKKVQEHAHDFTSLPVLIAKKTVTIRNMQRDLAERFPHKNQPLKHSLKIVIDSRRLLLQYLRETDYKKFEWLLEKLNIVYKPRPLNFEWVSRFVHQERLVDLWCDELKHHRLQCHKEQLESEQPEFLRQKAEKLKWIMGEEKELGLIPTVTQAEIDACYERSKSIEAKMKSKREDWPYHIYEKDTKSSDLIFVN